MVKIDHLKYFVAAAETGSFLAASSRANISPSSISYAVDRLEETLGTVLFVRKSAAGVSLTQDGERLLRRGKSILAEMEEIESQFGSRGGGLKGDLVVGCQEGLTWTLAPQAFAKIKNDNPDLRVSLKTTWMDTRFASLDSGEVDVLLTFTVNEDPPRHYYSVLLCEPFIYALMRKGHPLDRGGEPVSLLELSEYPQIFMQDGPAYEYYYGMYQALGKSPEVQTVSNVSTCAQALVGKSDAVSLRIMRPAHNFSPLGDEVVFPLLSDKVHLGKLYAVCVKDKRLASGDKRFEFIEVCRNLFETGGMRSNFYY